ncbi:unnamed protein product [Ixodes pacificus]
MHEESLKRKQVAATQALGSAMGGLGHSLWASFLLAAQTPFVETKTGVAPMDSPMDYQLACKHHGFKTWLSATIAPGRDAACPAPELRLFDDTSEHTFSDIFSSKEQRILMELGLTAEEARQLESNTRQQSLSKQWHSAREHRLTSSSFGAVNKREQLTEKGLRTLFGPRDLSHVRAIEYGRKKLAFGCRTLCVCIEKCRTCRFFAAQWSCHQPQL